MGEKLKEILKQPRTWIILAVAVGAFLLYRRARAGASQGGGNVPGPPAGAAGGGGGGGGMQSPLDQLGFQQAQLALAGQKSQQEYQGKLNEINLRERSAQQEYQQAGYRLQEQYQQGLLPSLISLGQAQYGTKVAEEKALEKVFKKGISCPGSASARIGPNGEMFCREKTSGGILGIPFGSWVRNATGIVTGVLYGGAQAAPGIGYSAANIYAGQQLGQLTGYRPLTQQYGTSPVSGQGGQPQPTGILGPGPSYGVMASIPAYPG